MTIPVANAQVIGCDYGVKPRVMIMGNMEFPEMLRSSFLALGYGRLPSFKLLVDAPFLGMAFNDDEVARRCFSIFKGWADASEDGDALSLSFIELEDGENGFCVYPETLLSRLAENQIVTDDSRRVTALDSASAG